MNSGYSGTPLAKKLSLKDGLRICFLNMPTSVRAEIDTYGLCFMDDCETPEAAHIFVTRKDDLSQKLAHFRECMARNGQIWVSWPKKASNVPSEVSEDTIREICLPLGLVDVKVCSIDAIWSGLKLVIRTELRET